MAEKMNTNANAVAVNGDFSVTYALSNGQSITLTPAIVKKLSNGNPLITDDEIELHIRVAQAMKLNPFTKEIMMVKYDGKKPSQDVVSINAFQRIADENPQYDGMEEGIIVQNSKGEIIDRIGCVVYKGETLVGGWAKVYRKDRRMPFVTRLSLMEYSKGQSTWTGMPATMINKCAKVGALRKAFPSSFTGLYAEEEIANANSGNFDEPKTEKTYDLDFEMSEKPAKESDKVIANVPETTTSAVNVNENGEIVPESQQTVADEDGCIVINYRDYSLEKDNYEKVDYPDGRKSFQKTNNVSTIRVRKIA